MVEDFVVGFEDAVRQPVVAHELPDVFLRIEFGAFRRDGDDGDIVGYLEYWGQVPTRLIHEQHGVGARSDVPRDFNQVQVHRVGIAEWQDEACCLTFLRADRAEDIGGRGALIMRRRWPRSALCPAPRDLVLLSDPGLVLKPDFYRGVLGEGLSDLVQLGGKAPFLNASTASGSCA